MRRLDATCVRASSLAAANFLRAAITLILVTLLSAIGEAGNTWDGGGADNNWTTGFNWNMVGLSQTPPANNGTANVVMAGTNRLTPTVDVAWDIQSLTFAVLAGSFTIESGLQDALTIGAGGVTNESGLTQTIDAEIVLDGDQTWNSQFGALQFNGEIGSATGHTAADLIIGGGYDTIFNGRVGGLRTLTKTGAQALLLNGTLTNTYTGTTYVNQGSLVINKEVADGAIRGDLVIGDGAGIDRVTLLRNEQIDYSPSLMVTVNSSGVFELNGKTETIKNLDIRGGRVDMTSTGSRLNVGGSNSGGGSLTMQGGTIEGAASSVLDFHGSTIRSEASATTGLIDAKLSVLSVVFIEVQDGEAEIDLDLTGLDLYGSGDAYKMGDGALRVRGSSYVERFHIDEGTLVLGTSAEKITFEGGTLRADLALSTSAEIDISGAATIDGPNDLTLFGVISGPGGLTKRGTGTVTFGSSTSFQNPNTYGGVTVVEEGTLALAKDIIAQNAAIVGDLVIGDGFGGPEVDVVRLIENSQILSAPGNFMTVNDSGLFDVNGKTEGIQDLIVNGGMVRVGTNGLLAVASLVMDQGTIVTLDGTLAVGGNISTVAAAMPASISGNMSLGGAARIFSVSDGIAPIDLDVSAVISNGALNKTSAGTMRLSGNNTFVGGVTISGGTLLVNSVTGSATGTGPVTVTNGTLGGTGTIAGSVENGGLVSPGTSQGVLTIAGNYTQTTTGELRIELASASSFDQLLITGAATLDGTLEISLIGGYAPLLGHSFNILDWGGTLTGTFATLKLPGLTGDLVWNTNDLDTTGVISVVLPGDYNGNGVVDTADYVAWRKNDGTQSGYDTWRANYGRIAGSGTGASANAAVPEPATLMLLVLAPAGWYFRRRRTA